MNPEIIIEFFKRHLKHQEVKLSKVNKAIDDGQSEKKRLEKLLKRKTNVDELIESIRYEFKKLRSSSIIKTVEIEHDKITILLKPDIADYVKEIVIGLAGIMSHHSEAPIIFIIKSKLKSRREEDEVIYANYRTERQAFPLRQKDLFSLRSGKISRCILKAIRSAIKNYEKNGLIY